MTDHWLAKVSQGHEYSVTTNRSYVRTPVKTNMGSVVLLLKLGVEQNKYVLFYTQLQHKTSFVQARMAALVANVSNVYNVSTVLSNFIQLQLIVRLLYCRTV